MSFLFCFVIKSALIVHAMFTQIFSCATTLAPNFQKVALVKLSLAGE